MIPACAQKFVENLSTAEQLADQLSLLIRGFLSLTNLVCLAAVLHDLICE